MTYKRSLLYRIPLWTLSAFGLLYLVVHTPLRQYLPGYLNQNQRALVEDLSMRIDSLEKANQIRSLYLDNMIAILSGTAEEQAIVPFDSAAAIIQDTLLGASERERDFVQNYEEQVRFHLEQVEDADRSRRPVFIAPLKGDELVPDDPSKLLGIDIAVTRETPVLSPLEGTIVSVTLVAGRGYEVIIQHPNDYLTIFSGLSMVLVEPRQVVKVGKVVGHVGGKSAMSNNVVNIQIWNRGNAIDPHSVMNF